MSFCVFDRQTGRYVQGARWDRPPHDPETQVLLKLPAFPDRRAERWDGADGVRPATAQELAEADAEDAEAEAKASLDGHKMLRLLIQVQWDQENRLRALEGKASVTQAQYRDALIARYKAL